MKETDIKAQFAERLKELCSSKGMPERGRQTLLGKQFNVTPNAARKWLLGLGVPELEMVVKLAKWGEVNVEWLLSGRGPKHGDKVPTRALVVDEIMRRGTPEERRQLVSMVRYNIEHSQTPIVEEERARYNAALESYLSERRPKH